MNELPLARFLGYFSIGLGLTELFAARPLARAVGLEGQETLVRAFGAREVATGLYILNNPDDPAGLWGRVAGDVADLAVLAGGLRHGDDEEEREDEAPGRTGAAIALAAVAGVTILDILCAGMLQRRDARVLETARRTHVRDLETRQA